MQPQRAAAAVFFVVSAAYLALAIRIEGVATSPAAAIGPRGFPLLVGGLGVLVSLLLFLAARPAAEGAIVATPTSAETRHGVFTGDWRRVLVLCALTLLYAVALPALGFTFATAAFLASSFFLLGERRPTSLVIVPFAVALVLLAVLRGGLDVYLPEPLLDAVLRSTRLSP